MRQIDSWRYFPCTFNQAGMPNDLSVVSALQVLPYWFHDDPPFGATGCFDTDLKLADAFRMLIHLAEPSAQLYWIEGELRRGPRSSGWSRPYETRLIRWWLDIFEDQSRNSDAASSDPARRPLSHRAPLKTAGQEFSHSGVAQ